MHVQLFSLTMKSNIVEATSRELKDLDQAITNFNIFGILGNAPKGHSRYYMKKDL